MLLVVQPKAAGGENDKRHAEGIAAALGTIIGPGLENTAIHQSTSRRFN